ncbi:MAG TPA: hypothetical protein VJT09_07310 [Pyrinomonadaceae bacterium]|nr:hypothetical protein [Pyrinomonadaceae bacterium]
MKTRLVVALFSFALLIGFSPELFGQKKKKVKDKRFEPAARQNLKDYEGTYMGIDPTYRVEISLGADGRLNVKSFENGRSAILENIRVQGARLLGTKTYTDGRTGVFEGTFSNRILNGESAFGILVEGMQIDEAGLSHTTIFYQRR